MELKGLPLEDLIALARAGQTDAICEILARHEDVIIGVIRSHLRGSSRAVVDTGDLLQSTYGVALTKLPFFEYRGDVPFRAWLRRVVENKLKQRPRDLPRSAGPESDDSDDAGAGAAPACDTDPEVRLEINEAKRLVEDELADLSYEVRESHRLHKDDGLTFADIGQRLRISERTARRHFSQVEARIAMVARDYIGGRRRAAGA